MAFCIIDTPIGYAKIVGDKDGVSSLSIMDTKVEISFSIPEELLECVTQLNAYFKNELTEFNLKLNPTGTLFQKKVWRTLENIPFGKTTSYLELSKNLGDTKAIRAVANANAKNPLWIIVPCHRVIGTNGNLTGYAGGLKRKQWLLNHENQLRQELLF